MTAKIKKMMENKSFIGKQLTRARNRKGLSMQDVADLIGVQRQYLHKIETEKEDKALSKAQIEKIADELGVMPAFFYSEGEVSISHDKLHFRSIAIPNYVRERAKILAEDVASVCMFVRDYISPLGLSFPEFSLDEKICSDHIRPDGLYANEIDQVALEVRRILGLGEGPIANLVRVLESQGIIVTSCNDISSKVDAFCNDDYYPVVIYNDEKSPVRCRFDLGHEFAHLVIHKGINNDIVNNPFIEKQANYFASSLMLPRKAFVNEFPRFDGHRIPWNKLVAMKKRWKISLGAIISRAYHLNLITSETYKKAFIQIASKGWKTKEPLDSEHEDDFIPYEKPELMHNAVTMIMNTHRDMLPKMKEEVKLSNDVLRQLLSMPDLEDQDFEHRGRLSLTLVHST